MLQITDTIANSSRIAEMTKQNATCWSNIDARLWPYIVQITLSNNQLIITEKFCFGRSEKLLDQLIQNATFSVSHLCFVPLYFSSSP
jgi:hypothetical protein